jgi:hypothetical protein
MREGSLAVEVSRLKNCSSPAITELKFIHEYYSFVRVAQKLAFKTLRIGATITDNNQMHFEATASDYCHN